MDFGYFYSVLSNENMGLYPEPYRFDLGLGSGHYLWPKGNVFLGENFADPTIKESKKFLPNLKYQ
jgi:hypothetical protein